MRGSLLRPFVLTLSVGMLLVSAPLRAQVAGQNVNMVSGTQWPGGDPFLQRQNEPSLAVSSRNLLHLVAGANDYRTVDLPTEAGSIPGTLSGDAWLGIFKSFDGGQSWQSTLLPGYPQDQSAVGMASPLKVYGAAADPTVRAGANGLVYYSGMAFNRGTNIGAVFLTRYFDLNNKENGDATDPSQSKDPIAYVDTKLIDTGTSGQFLDKPWLAVDVPRSGSGATTCSFTPPGGTAQSFVGGNVYMTWSRFTGSSSTKIMFSRSVDCGKTWSNPIKISESNSINQGTNIAVDPTNGTVYVTWRRFAASSQTDAILVAKSTNFGQTFPSKDTVQVATISPLDQSTTGTRFRTNALPSIAASVDSSNVSRVHIAWAQRNTNSDAQIVVATSADGGKSWSTPAAVDAGAIVDDTPRSFSRGHQFMPQLTFSQGRLMVLYYDQRLDHTLGLLTPNQPFAPDASGRFYDIFRDLRLEPAGAAPVFGLTIDDLGLQARRHTVDLRVAEAIPGATLSFSSASVSQYKVGLRSDLNDEKGNPIPLPITSLNQLQANPPNLPLFAQGTVPFLGDYIDIAGPTIVPNGTGGWKFNTASTSAPVFYATWTDNRDVVPPTDGNWANYTPVGGGGTSILDPTKSSPPCSTGQEGMRNQNIYSSRITDGLLVGSPQNVKPLFAAPKTRAFIVTLQNLTARDRTFTMTLAPGSGVSNASFEQKATPTTLLTVTVAAGSGAARPVFASGTPAGRVTVNVAESGPGSIGLSGSVTLNPEGTVSSLVQPDGTTVDIGNVEIYTPTLSFWNPANPNPYLNIADPNISNPNISNPNISNVDPAIFNVANPNISNPNISNPNISNPNISNRNVANPDPAVLGVANPNISNTIAANPNISNPNISNPNISNATISDTTYAMTNSGNTTHSYRVALYGNNPSGAPLQLIVTKNYAAPTSVGCTLQTVPQNTVLANVNNALIAPALNAATDPNIPDGQTTNATVALAPGETAFVTLRGALTPDQMAQLTRGLTPVVTAHGKSGAANEFAALLFIQTTSGTLPVAIVGVPYNGTGYQFQSVGGSGTISWTFGGALPTGLTLSPSGLLSGTPSGAGTFTFTVTASDGSATPQTSTQSISMTVAARATSTAVTLAKNPIVVGEAVSATVTVTDTQAGGTASSPAGTASLSGDPGLSATTCALVSSAPGISTCSVAVTPTTPGPRTISASYAGTATHMAGSGSAALTVNPAATTVTLSSSLNPSGLGQAVTFTARVTVTAPGAGTPSGSVTFRDDATTLGTGALDASGTATFSTAALAAGSHPVTATYSGEPRYGASASGIVTQVVLSPPSYTFTGFGSPLATAGTASNPSYSGVQNLGSATPIKFQLRDSVGANVTDLGAVLSIVAAPNATCSGQPTGTPILLYSPTVGATGGSTFRASSSGYTFNWDTSVVVPNGPGCYTLVVQLNDASTARATTIRLQ